MVASWALLVCCHLVQVCCLLELGVDACMEVTGIEVALCVKCTAAFMSVIVCYLGK